MAAVASQPNLSAYPSQLRGNSPSRHRATQPAKYSTSGRLPHSPPSKTAILALHRYTNDRPSKRHCHRTPQTAHNVRAQILAGADVDLSSLLSLLPTSDSNRQIDCGDFSVTLKKPNPLSSRILSFPEFSIAFSRFTEIICSVFPHRRTRVVLWRRALLHVPQTVLRKMRLPNCTVEPMPLLGRA